MSSRLLFVLVMAMLVSNVLSGKCFDHVTVDGTEMKPKKEISCSHNTCGKGVLILKGKTTVSKTCGDTPKCEKSEQSVGDNGVEATGYCCEGELCNSSNSTSIVAVALLSLFIM